MENYEQKYKEALEKVKELYTTYGDADVNEALEDAFPELKESEDEKIRKELLQFVDINTLSIDERHDRWIAWLEKQKQPKWSEEDSERLHRIIDFLWHNRKGDTDTIWQQEQDADWLKQLKERLR